MKTSKEVGNMVLVFINMGVLLGIVLGYRNYNVDKYSMFAIGGVSLLVLNGMFFAIRASEKDLPRTKAKQLNKWVVWPIYLFSALLLAHELFCGKQ
jgi:hypothetical protein